MKNYKIAVAGTGYVGLSLGVLLSQHHQVVAVDIVQAKVDMINNKKSPIQDRKLNEQLTAIMEDTLVWERALSLRNPWIQQMAQYKAPEELDRSFVKKYIEQVTVTLLGDGQAEIGLTMKTYEWKQMLGRIEMEETDDGTKE